MSATARPPPGVTRIRAVARAYFRGMAPPRASGGRAARASAGRRRLAALCVVVIVAGVVGLGLVRAWRAIRPSGVGDEVALDPAAFAPGACVALSPTAGDNHHTVFLDAGHGGVDPGAVGTTQAGAEVHEGTLTLPVELDTAALLRARGYRVVVSRTGDTTVTRVSPSDLSGAELSLTGAHDDVAARDRCADLAQADVLVGIYFDSAATADAAGSVTTYDAVRPFSPDSRRLATVVQTDVLRALDARGWGIPDRGVVTDDSLGSLVPTTSSGAIARGAASYGHLLLLGPARAGYFTTPSTMPGAVVEPLFITDPFEASIAASSSGQGVLAEGLAAAVEGYFAPRSGKVPRAPA